MVKSFVNDYKIMLINAAVLTFFYLMLCLSFNYTLPLHRSGFAQQTVLDNHSQSSGQEKLERSDGIIGRTRNIAANFEHALKKLVDSTPKKIKSKKESKCSNTNHAIIDSDLSSFEQLVIMKKYPFLDLQEADYSYHPSSNKKSVQSLNSAHNLAQDPSFCEPSDEGPSVEITNRGLSGFAIPAKLIKTENQNKINVDPNNTEDQMDTQSKPTLSTPSNNLTLMKNLEEDIKLFEKQFLS